MSHHDQSDRPAEHGRDHGLSHLIDPDVDLHDPAQVTEILAGERDLLLAIGIGAILGAEARYGLGVAVAHSAGQFPWSTVLINVAGCLLIGVLMGVLLTMRHPPRLARPFLGVGILGGFTTFSTFSVDVVSLLRHHHPLAALAYLLLTGAGCALAVWATMTATSALRTRSDA
ncbi:MAG: fluoride efflux transporter CrcB [Jatrophihabitans sp.]